MTTPKYPPRRDMLRALTALSALAALSVAGCGGSGSDSSSPPPPAPTGPIGVTPFRSGLTGPWGMAFLPDGRLLVTEKGGTLRVISADGSTLSTIDVVFPGGLYVSGQGGLLDVAIDPDFATSPWVYLSYSQPDSDGNSGTAVLRGQLSGNALTNVAQIFEALPKTPGDVHFGSRLVFANDKTLFVTLGEHQLGSPAQDTGSHLGKVVRINRNGSTPSGNPSFGAGALANLWTMGHRNPQGAALHPVTGQLWVGEHGPQGGDEINLALPGRNFGWPDVSYGCNYGDPYADGDNTVCRIGGGTHAPTYTEPLAYWVPESIAPSGMLFYTGSMFPEWQGHLFMGAMSGNEGGKRLWRMTVTNSSITAREQVLPEVIKDIRIRDVAQGPDGAIYLIEETNGQVLRIAR